MWENLLSIDNKNGKGSISGWGETMLWKLKPAWRTKLAENGMSKYKTFSCFLIYLKYNR